MSLLARMRSVVGGTVWLPTLCATLLRYSRLLLLMCAFCAQALHAQILVENATVITVQEGVDEPFTGYLLVGSDGVIGAVGSGVYPGVLPASTERVDASGKLVIPGFVSGHNHLWQSAFRGIALDQVLYPWLDALHRTYGPYFADGDFYWFTLHGALDQLLHGITTTYSHSQRLDGTEAQYLESMAAEMEVPQHFIFAYNNDLDQTPAAMAQTFAAFMQQVKANMAMPASPMLGAALNAVGNFAPGDGLAREMALAKQYGIGVQIHYLEQYSNRDSDRAQWETMKQAGALTEHTTFAHFIHTTDSILHDSAAAGVGMIWNPLSNGRLASGLSDIPHYLALGVKVGMGVDGAASGDISDPFENMRMGMYALRMQSHDPNTMSAERILRLHTLDTAKVLGVADKVGSLEVGKLADFLILDPSTPLTGDVINPVPHLVAAMNAMNIEAIYVAGKLAVTQGKVLLNAVKHDTQAVQAEVVKRVGRIRIAADKPAP
jgi:5-methylthioadenosine/S-adenosylhomocysteine deaminase